MRHCPLLKGYFMVLNTMGYKVIVMSVSDEKFKKFNKFNSFCPK